MTGQSANIYIESCTQSVQQLLCSLLLIIHISTTHSQGYNKLKKVDKSKMKNSLMGNMQDSAHLLNMLENSHICIQETIMTYSQYLLLNVLFWYFFQCSLILLYLFCNVVSDWTSRCNLRLSNTLYIKMFYNNYTLEGCYIYFLCHLSTKYIVNCLVHVYTPIN